MATLIEESTLGKRLLPRIVLIACGSFSPPTLMHFRMFEIARDYFELHGTHEVVGGIVSPTHDAYGKKGLVEATHRCAMVKLALQSSKWIRTSDWETQQEAWSRTLSVLQHHQNYINNYIKSGDGGMIENNELLPSWLPPGLRERSDPVQLRLLCGADLLESFAVPGLWADEDIANIIGNHGLVVITRSGANPEKFIFDSDILTKYQRNITLVTNWVANDVSSTMIRRLVGRGMSVKYLTDDLVIEYIKQKKLFNSKSKHLTHTTTTAHTPMQLVYNVEYANQKHQQQRLKVKNKISKINDNKNANNNADNNNDVLRPTQTQTTTSNYTNDESDDEILEDVKRMNDETDFAMKNILNSFHLNQKTNVFCCGETAQVGSKLLLSNNNNRRNSPGQAVRTVITAECSGVSGAGCSGVNAGVNKERLREAEELKPKKMKITAPQNV